MNQGLDDATYEAPETALQMLIAAWALLYSLSPELRRAIEFPLDAPERLDWDFIPKPDRAGVPLSDLDQHQRQMAHNLLSRGLSLDGYAQALQVMAMENVLRVRDAAKFGLSSAGFRHSEHYFFTFFGRPGFEDTWAWRILGHHLSITFTIVEQRWVTATPFNLGAEPAAVGSLAPLRTEEDRAFSLLHALSEDVRDRVLIHDRAPADYVTRQVDRVGAFELPDYYDLGLPHYRITEEDRQALKFVRDQPRGVSGGDVDSAQSDDLRELVFNYLGRLPDEIARPHMRRVENAHLDDVFFCWAGGMQRGTSHYFRVQTPDYLIEFDNAIDRGNHIHTIWRDLRNDLGGDTLLNHYERTGRTPQHLATRLTSSETHLRP